MRILYTSDTVHPRINGVSTSIDVFRHELGKRGHEVWVLGPRYDTESGSERVVRAASWRAPLTPEDRLLRPRRAIQAVESAMPPAGVQLIHVQTPFSAFLVGHRLARRWRIPLLYTHHTDFAAYAAHYAPAMAGAVRAWARALARWQSRRTDMTIVPTAEVGEQLRGFGVRGRMAVVPTGVPIDEFRDGDGARFRAAHGIPGQVPLLGYVGRLASEKNLHFLLQVFAAVRRERPETRLVMAGEGPARGELEAQSRALGVTYGVHWVGYLHRRSELLDCYRAADVFVFASRTETQGLVLLEAMALGVPVVAVPAAGTRRVLAPGQGALVAPEDVGELARRVLAVLGDADLARDLSRSGRLWVERHWSAAAAAERLEAVYLELNPNESRADTGEAPSTRAVA